MGLNNIMENESISKELEAALESFKAKSNQAPEGYFDQFEAQILAKIQAKEQLTSTTFALKNNASIISIFRAQKKYMVAASVVLMVVSGYFLYNSSDTKSILNNEIVGIETLPDAVIEGYINNNELVAEVEWNTAIEAAGAAVSFNNN